MPQIFREKGWVASFYSNERNEPVHVHLRKGGGEAKFQVRPVALAMSEGLKVKELAEAEALVAKHATEILRKWNEHFSH